MGSQGGGSGESLHYQDITKSNTAQSEHESAIELFAELLGRGFRIQCGPNGETVISPRDKLTPFDIQRLDVHQRTGHMAVLTVARQLLFEAPWCATAVFGEHLPSGIAAVAEIDPGSGFAEVRGELDDSRRAELERLLSTIQAGGRVFLGIPKKLDGWRLDAWAAHGASPIGWIGLPAATTQSWSPPVSGLQ